MKRTSKIYLAPKLGSYFALGTLCLLATAALGRFAFPSNQIFPYVGLGGLICGAVAIAIIYVSRYRNAREESTVSEVRDRPASQRPYYIFGFVIIVASFVWLGIAIVIFHNNWFQNEQVVLLVWLGLLVTGTGVRFYGYIVKWVLRLSRW